MIVGARRTSAGNIESPVEAALVTVWRDLALMARATDIDEQDRFLGLRLRLPLEADRADHYEIVGRTFAALPPESSAYLPTLTVRARPNDPVIRHAPWRTLIERGRVSGEGPWLVPDSGAVFIRYIAERDVPIEGRHTVLVHRWNEPPPTIEDLEEALVEAFPARASVGPARAS